MSYSDNRCKSSGFVSIMQIYKQECLLMFEIIREVLGIGVFGLFGMKLEFVSMILDV